MRHTVGEHRRPIAREKRSGENIWISSLQLMIIFAPASRKDGSIRSCNVPKWNSSWDVMSEYKSSVFKYNRGPTVLRRLVN